MNKHTSTLTQTHPHARTHRHRHTHTPIHTYTRTSPFRENFFSKRKKKSGKNLCLMKMQKKYSLFQILFNFKCSLNVLRILKGLKLCNDSLKLTLLAETFRDYVLKQHIFLVIIYFRITISIRPVSRFLTAVSVIFLSTSIQIFPYCQCDPTMFNKVLLSQLETSI